MMQTLDSAAFPVILILHKGRLATVCHTELDLGTCAAGALRTDCFAPPYLAIDAALTRFAIGGVTKLGPAGPLWGFSLMYGRRLRIRHEVTGADTITIEQLRSLLRPALRSGLTLLESGGESAAVVVAALDKAQSFAAVVDLIDR